jgi:hypothetical protein
MPRLYLLIGLAALSLFSYGQYRGIGLFDDTATTHSRGPAARSTFHK